MSKQTSENLRYLLWRAGVDRQNWPAQLAEWADCDQQRAKALLKEAELLPDEQEQIAERMNVTEEDLQFKRLVEGLDILWENLRYFFESLEHGEGKKLAADTGTDQVTVSRWRTEGQRPRKYNQVALCHFFGLPSDTDLEHDPVFLSMSPISDRRRRDWLRERIDLLDAAELQDLFPALERLFRD
jgi:transcriptional regulator with XRE-family HTH domain